MDRNATSYNVADKHASEEKEQVSAKSDRRDAHVTRATWHTAGLDPNVLWRKYTLNYKTPFEGRIGIQ